MLDYLEDLPPGCKRFGDLAQAFVLLAVFACTDKSEQKERIMLAYEWGNLTADEAGQLIRTLGLKEA